MNEELLKSILAELQSINENLSNQNKEIIEIESKIDSVTGTCEGRSFIRNWA